MAGEPYARSGALYDAIYGSGVDYDGDVRFLLACAERFSRVPVARVADLGCGTGGHAERLAAHGLHVQGLDLSEELLAQARRKRDRLPPEHAARLDYRHGDMADALPPAPFDMAVSMFGAWCYLVDDARAAALLGHLAERLPRGGLFVFEFWSPYGFRPAPRWEDVPLPEGRRLLRLAKPESDALQDDVYRFSFEHLVLRGDALEERFREEHALRLRTPHQTRLLLEAHGFEAAAFTAGARQDKSFAPPSPETFRVMAVARRR